MPREFAKTNLTIWQDPEWRALPWPAQHLYKMLWDHPGLSYCGVIHWRPSLLLGWGAGWTRGDLNALIDCLRARHFIVVDDDTEECLVRAWVRFDGILKQPRLTVSMCNAFGEVGSNMIRGVIVSELQKLRGRQPEASGWAKEQPHRLLELPAIDAKSLDLPQDPFGSGFAIGLGTGLGDAWGSVSAAFGGNATSGLGSGLGIGLGSPYNSNNNSSTATLGGTSESTPAPSAPKDAAPPPTKKTSKKPARPLPDSWTPNEAHRSAAAEKQLDVEHEAQQFRNHAQANDRRQADWDASFRQWLGNTNRFANGGSRAPTSPPQTRLPYAHEVQAAPSGLSNEEYLDWLAAQRESRS